MAPALGDPGRGRPAGGLPRLSARLRPAHARPPAADAGLSPGRPLRRGAPPLAGDARRAGRRPLLPRALRGARAHPAALSRGRAAGGRRAPGARAGRGLLLPPGPHVPALDLGRAGGARRDAAGRLAARQSPAPRQLPAPARAGGGHQRHRGRGDRHHPGAALARHGHRGRGGGRRHVPRGARRARARRARGAARALPAPRGGRGDHGLGPRLAGRAARRLEPLRGRSRPHLRRALAVRDPDRSHRAPAPARHPAHRGDPRAARGRRERGQARLRRRAGRRPLPGGAPRHGSRGARDPAHLARAGALLPGADGPGPPPLHHGQVPHHARRRRAEDGPRAGERERSAHHLARALSPRAAPGRAAAAVERALRRHELRRPAPGAARVRARLRARHPGLRRALQGAPGAHRLRAGERRVPHLARDQAQVRPGLHLQPLPLARRPHPGGHGEGDAHPARRLSVTVGPPLAARRAADTLLGFTAAAIPLSTTGMEAGVLGLAALSCAALVGKWGVVRGTPLDGVLALFAGVMALSTLASGHPLEASGWVRLWIALAYFVVFWWLRDPAHAVRVARDRRARLVLPACAAAAGLAFAVTPALRAEAAHMFSAGGANAGRVGIYRANLEIVHARPLLGLGFGRYRTAAPAYYAAYPAADRRSHAHNNFLQMAAEAGLAGLAAFGLVYATVLRRGAETIERAPDGATWAAAAGAWAGVVGFLVGGLTQYTFGDAEVAIAMWVALAILARLGEEG